MACIHAFTSDSSRILGVDPESARAREVGQLPIGRWHRSQVGKALVLDLRHWDHCHLQYIEQPTTSDGTI
jgi:hypothetical protein